MNIEFIKKTVNSSTILSDDDKGMLINNIIRVQLTPEDVYKEIKENIIFDFETLLDCGDNRIEKEIQTEWGLIRICFIINNSTYCDDKECDQLDVEHVFYPEVYDNEGAKIEMEFLQYLLMDSLKHLNIKY